MAYLCRQGTDRRALSAAGEDGVSAQFIASFARSGAAHKGLRQDVASLDFVLHLAAPIARIAARHVQTAIGSERTGFFSAMLANELASREGF